MWNILLTILIPPAIGNNLKVRRRNLAWLTLAFTYSYCSNWFIHSAFVAQLKIITNLKTVSPLSTRDKLKITCSAKHKEPILYSQYSLFPHSVTYVYLLAHYVNDSNVIRCNQFSYIWSTMSLSMGKILLTRTEFWLFSLDTLRQIYLLRSWRYAWLLPATPFSPLLCSNEYDYVQTWDI